MRAICFCLFAVALAVPAASASRTTQASEVVLYSFCQHTSCPDGASPNIGLIADGKGGFYGTTEVGGKFGGGIVFNLHANGIETILHAFPTCGWGQSCSDGSNPFAGLIEDGNGNLYGTTITGGEAQCLVFPRRAGNPTQSCGTVFEISNEGVESVVLSFNGSNGYEPLAALIEDTSGDFYGTTYFGGDYYSSECPDVTGCGAVFKTSSSGQVTVLYQFCQQSNCADGEWPQASLLMDSSGNLYGTTFAGGTGPNCSGYHYGCGTAFEIATDGTETVLYRFCSLSNCADGELPTGSLIMDSGGTLYGTTSAGGPHGSGTVFSLDPGTGVETTLYWFCGRRNCTDGAYPGGLLDVNGKLYGTTSGGGSHGEGTMFSLDPGTGVERVLYSFCSQPRCTDGANPQGLIPAGDGKFFGTTLLGGKANRGTVFEIQR